MIRRATPADIDELLRVRLENREYLARWEPHTSPPGRRWTREYYEEWVTGENQFVILDEGELAGTIQLVDRGWDALRSAMVGYWVAQARAGRGLATRALREILDVAFGELGLHRVEAGTDVENVPSQRVLERAGFTRVGLLRKHLLIGDTWHDHYLWELLEDDPR